MSNANPYETTQQQPAQQGGYSTRMMTIRKIDPLSAGKLLGCFYALIGLVFGGFLTIVAIVGVAADGGQNAAIGGLVTGIGAILIMPLFYGVAGFVGGLIGAFLYNIVASIAGGISLEIEV